MQNEEKKYDYINFIRGLAIFLMLWGHCIQHASCGAFDIYEDPFFRFIYSFHMPLFIMISGFLFFGTTQKRPIKELLCHKTKHLLQPIIMCTILNYYIVFIPKFFIDRTTVWEGVGGNWLKNLTDLWFLWTILCFSIIVGICVKITQKKILKILSLVMGWIFTLLFPVAQQNFYLYPFFIFGYFIAQKEIYLKITIKKLYIIATIAIILFCILYINYHKKHFINISGILGTEYSFKDYIIINFIRWGIGFIGCILLVTVSYLIFDKIYSVKVFYTFRKGMENMGIYSLEIYALSVSLLSSYLPAVSRFIFQKFFLFDISKYWLIFDIIITLAIAILYSFILVWITKLLYKYKIGECIFGYKKIH